MEGERCGDEERKNPANAFQLHISGRKLIFRKAARIVLFRDCQRFVSAKVKTVRT
jgi:hypothetical protein